MKDYPVVIPQYLAKRALELGEITQDTYDKLLRGEPDYIGLRWCYVSRFLEATSTPPKQG